MDPVERAVRAKHAKDLVVPECKDGPTWTSSHKRLDFWVLKRSWTNPAMIGYEVKCSRSDFLQDDKWPHYLKLCNQLAFIITDPKVLDASELPQDVGLFRVAGDRLLTVRKPVWRKIEPPTSLMTYVLMSRTTIGRDSGVPEDPHEQRRVRAARWAAILRDEDDMRVVGRAVSKRVATALRERITQVEARQDAYEGSVDRFMAIVTELRRRGAQISWGPPDKVAEDVLAQMKTALTPEDRRNLLQAQESIQRLLGTAQGDQL